MPDSNMYVRNLSKVSTEGLRISNLLPIKQYYTIICHTMYVIHKLFCTYVFDFKKCIHLCILHTLYSQLFTNHN